MVSSRVRAKNTIAYRACRDTMNPLGSTGSGSPHIIALYIFALERLN